MTFSSLAEWLAWQEQLHPRAVDLSLERLQRTLARLGWHRPSCPVITIAGTNGKGSTVAMIAGILRTDGYRVGTFTSPHLIRYNERICVDGSPIDDTSLMQAFERIDAARKPDTLTFFEFNTLAALLIFETAGLDAIVLEVGLGGRLDAVNVVDADVAVITSIALDHCDWLGNDVEAIGREKAGIMRRGRPAIYGSHEMPSSIAASASEIGSDLRRLGYDFNVQHSERMWTFTGREHTYRDLPIPALKGHVQLDNAATALAALECLASHLPVTTRSISAALSGVQLPGRYQGVRYGAQWILDVAHNPAAAEVLAAQLRHESPRGRSFAVCGILADKDATKILEALHGVFDGWIVAEMASGRARPRGELAALLQRSGANVVASEPNVIAACERAAAQARNDDLVVVFGSFLVVGPALSWLLERAEERQV